MLSTKKISTFNGVVIKAIKETTDTFTLYIFCGNETNHYKAGQFISINPKQFNVISDLVKFFEYKKQKKEVVRAYSLASAPFEKYLKITIKQENYYPEHDDFPPLLSPLLASDLLVGKEIELSGFSGAYIMPEDKSDIEEVIHLTAGSGIVPSFSIIKNELFNNQKQIHKLLYVNKRSDDIIYKSDLEILEKEYPNNFFVYHFLTRENNFLSNKNYFLRRPELEDVKKIIKDPKKALFFACGPAITKWQKRHYESLDQTPPLRFMEWVESVIHELNIDKKKYKKEVYG